MAFSVVLILVAARLLYGLF